MAVAFAIADRGHHDACSQPPLGPHWSLYYPMDTRRKEDPEEAPTGAYIKTCYWQPFGSAVTGHT